MSARILTGDAPTSRYLVEAPGLISFSGGRTSAFLLKQILDAHGGALPPDVHVAFANTGKERPETLDFVRECAERWNVRIRWVEYRTPSREEVTGLVHLPAVRAALVEMEATLGGPGRRTDKQRAKIRREVLRAAIRSPQAAINFREVTWETASRRGEPFAAIIRRRNFVPNPVTRFCTQELKIRAMKNFMQSLGYAHWTNVLGIRADEPHRLAKVRNGVRNECYEVTMPLVADGITKPAINAWWSAQPFDLRLRPWEGNCDLCFLKGWAKRVRIARDNPELVDWWAEAEAEAEAVHQGVARHPRYSRFRKDTPSYARLKLHVLNQPLLDLDADDFALTEPDALAMCAGCMD